jgi:phage N-6-adenine-methyltransferase
VSILRFKPRNHPQQTAKRGRSQLSLFPELADLTDEVDDRCTPAVLWDPLMERFGFTIDVAASRHNTKLPRFFTLEDDGLAQRWAGERVWCNPPYSNIRPWIEKAWREWGDADLIVMLLPANRTEQTWWQELVEPLRDGDLHVEFLAGRVKFDMPEGSLAERGHCPPFGSCLLIWGPG